MAPEILDRSAHIPDGPTAGPEVRIRLLTGQDRALYRALYTCPEVMREIGPPLSEAELDVQFGRVVRHNGAERPGHRAWAILDSEGCGTLGLMTLFRDGNVAELGIMLRATARRRGFASASLRALLPIAFGELGLKCIVASRRAGEHAHVIDRLLLPLGFRRGEGLRPGDVGWQLTRACRDPAA